jgi:purine nucleoside permease
MEDSATLQSLTFLANAGRVDKERVMILRTASNFTMQPHSLSAADNLRLERTQGYAAMNASIEAAYKVGSQVVSYLIEHWEVVKNKPPSAH